MPDPKDNAKASGDFHPPELDEVAQQRPRSHADTEGASGKAGQTGQTGAAGLERDLQDESRPGKGENQAGFLKDKDA